MPLNARAVHASSQALVLVEALGLSACAMLFAGGHAALLAAQTPPAAPPAAQAPPAASPAPPEVVAPPAGIFTTRMVAGGAPNGLLIDAQPGDLPRLPRGTIEWRSCAGAGPNPSSFAVLSKAPEDGNNSKTLLTVQIPPPPCRWPPYQYAKITLTGDVTAQGRTQQAQTLFEGTLPVSVLWVPLVITLGSLGLIYPGCAMIAWYLARRRQAKAGNDRRAPPSSFWDALDPVQITANAYGRASLAKLQIFGFSLIVFGLLLYYQLRTGVLSGLSKDVLILLGISAVGTAGGRVTYAAKRRLALENWCWLRQKEWLPPNADIAARAKWRELIIDTDNKEFDTYSFQMAIFSLVVAVALISSSLTGLSTFEIPGELLGLLGLSQVIYIGGKAADKSGYAELDEKISTLRIHEKNYQEAVATESATSDEKEKAAATGKAKTERDAFKTEAAQAADMFWALYSNVIGKKPVALDNIDQLEPATFQPAPAA
jgi:hypothetical protein